MAHKFEHVSTGAGFSVLNDGVKTEVIAQDGTIKGDIKEALAQGSIYIGNSSGVTSELSVKGDTKVLVGNGTTATSVALNGNATMTNAGVVTVTGASGNFTGSGRGIFNNAPTAHTTPTLSVGVYGTPVVDATLVDNIAFTANMSTATNKTASDTSCMAAFFGASNTAATANNKLQAVLASTTVGGNCFDAYGVQGHVNVIADATATSNGNIVGMSAKATVASGKTATGTVSGLLVTVDGEGTVTGTHSGLWIDNVAASDQAILITGSNKLGINMNGVSISAGTATDDASIKSAQGATAANGSMYISTNGTVFFMVSGTWTPLTIN